MQLIAASCIFSSSSVYLNTLLTGYMEVETKCKMNVPSFMTKTVGGAAVLKGFLSAL